MTSRRRRFIYGRGAWAAGLVLITFAVVVLAGRAAGGGWISAVGQGLLGIAALVAADRLLRPRGPRPIPVLTYHSVACRELRERWERLGWGNLTVSADLFSWHLGYLARRGFRTVGLDDLYQHVKGEEEAPAKSLVITFDDGYVDNWVFAAPLLSRHGFQATVFVSSDFIEPSEEVRPSLEDVWAGRSKRSDLPYEGYLSWGELRELGRRGIMEAQGHATSHTWHFAGDCIVDFYRHPDHYVWLFWNLCPERKRRWQEEDRASAVALGRPIYAFHRSQVRRRYFPDEGLAAALVRLTAEGGEDFFRRPGWRNTLETAAASYRAEHPDGGKWETAAEYWQRVRHDLAYNKNELERELGRPVNFLAWPGDAQSPGLRRLALGELGFLATTESEGLNRPGEDATWLGRVHVESNFEGTRWVWLDRLEFAAKVELFGGNLWFLALAVPVAVLRRLLLAARVREHAAIEPPVAEGVGVVEGAP